MAASARFARQVHELWGSRRERFEEGMVNFSDDAVGAQYWGIKGVVLNGRKRAEDTERARII